MIDGWSPLGVGSDSCIILISCLFHVMAKLALINNGQQLDTKLRASEEKLYSITSLSLRLRCHRGSWNHICYLYVPQRRPACYFRKATATVIGTASAY